MSETLVLSITEEDIKAARHARTFRVDNRAYCASFDCPTAQALRRQTGEKYCIVLRRWLQGGGDERSDRPPARYQADPALIAFIDAWDEGKRVQPGEFTLTPIEAEGEKP